MSDPADTPYRLSAEDAEEYTRALGQIMSGGWRQIALAKRLGVPEALGMTTDAWVSSRIGGYVRLGLDDRRLAARELTDPDGEFQMTHHQAAEVLGVGETTVRRDLHGPPHGGRAAPSLEGDDDDGAPHGGPEGWAEPSVEPSLADNGADPHGNHGDDHHDAGDDGSVPDEPSPPTMGEILGPDFVINDAGLAEELASNKRTKYATGVLDALYTLTLTHEPSVLVEAELTERLPTRARLLDLVIAWLERARTLASEPRTQIRRVP